MITQKIKSLKDQTLNTMANRKSLVMGEVVSMIFLSQTQLMSFVDTGVLELANQNEPERKVIPVIGERKFVDDVTKREIEMLVVFDPGFKLEEHLRNGV